MTIVKYANPLILDGGTSIASSTDATPIVVTTNAAHQLVVGQTVYISGHTTNTNANGEHTVSAVGSATTFTLADTTATGGGAGSGGAITAPIHKNGRADLRVESISVENSSGGAYDISVYDGFPSEFGESSFVSVNTADNSVSFTDAHWKLFNGANLRGRRFVNSGESYHIVDQESRKLYLDGTSGLDKDAAWTISGRLLKNMAGASTDLSRDFYVGEDTSWSGLWITGTEDDIVVTVHLRCGSRVIAEPTSTGFVGNLDGSRWIKIA